MGATKNLLEKTNSRVERSGAINSGTCQENPASWQRMVLEQARRKRYQEGEKQWTMRLEALRRVNGRHPSSP